MSPVQSVTYASERSFYRGPQKTTGMDFSLLITDA